MPDIRATGFEYLFATPVMIHRWDNSEALNGELLTVIFERERTAPSKSKSNVGGWQSTDDLASWAGETGKRMVERMMTMTNHATRLLFTQLGAAGEFGWKFAMWANINRRGQYNKMHFHPGSTWSGVYYVDVGDAPGQDNPLAGSIGFMNPNQAAAMSFFVGQVPHSRTINPETSMMLLFPSYVPHTVYPYEGERPRVSIAFNIHKDPYP